MGAGGGGSLGGAAGEGVEAAGSNRREPTVLQPDEGKPLPGSGGGIPEQLGLGTDQRDGPDMEQNITWGECEYYHQT